MKIAKRPDPELLHIAAASLRVWLLDVVVWLAEWLGVKLPRDIRMDLRRELSRALKETRMLVLLLAVSRMRIPIVTPRTTRPLSAPRGCRRARLAPSGRAYDRGLRLRGRSLKARLMELRNLFDNLDYAVRQMLKHLRRRWRSAAILLVAVVAERLRGVASVAPICMDTS